MPPVSQRHASVLAEYLASSREARSRTWILENFGAHSLNACLANGSVTRALPSTYVATSLESERDIRVRAASVWLGSRGAITGTAGVWVWGGRDVAPAKVNAQVRPNLHLVTPPWLKLVRPDVTGAGFVVGGVRVVAPTDAVLHAWNELRGDESVGTVVDAVRKSLTSAPKLAEAAGRTPRVRNRRHLMKLLGLLDGGVTSYLEYVARSKVFPRHAFPHLEWQVPMRVAARPRTLDAFDREARLALEFDSRAHHSSEFDRLGDIERDAEFASAGIQTLRLTYDALTTRPQWCRDVYRAARRARLRARIG